MTENDCSRIEASLKNYSSKISAPIGIRKINVWKTISSKLSPVIKNIEQNPDLTDEAKLNLKHYIFSRIYTDIQNYVPTNIPTWQHLVQGFLNSKINKSWETYMDNYLGTFNEKIKAVTLKDKQNKKNEEKKSNNKKDEGKKDKFTDLKDNILKSLGYTITDQGKRIEDNSNVEKWMIASGGVGLSKTSRGFWADEIIKMTNMSQLNKFLRDNRLEFSNGHLKRDR